MQAKKAAVRLQTVARGHAARRKLARMHDAALRVQTVWRGSLQRGRYKAALHEKHRNEAAVKVQARWRGCMMRCQRQEMTAAAVKIQAAWRCHHQHAK